MFYNAESGIKMNCSCQRYFLLLPLLFITLTCFPQTRSLQYYIREGLQNSPLLKDLQNELKSASIDSLIVIARRKPHIELQSQLLYSPFSDHLGYDEVITDGGNYQAVGYVSQSIFSRKLIENEFNSIENQKNSLIFNKRLSTADVKKTITNLYLESYSIYSDLQFNRSFFKLMDEQSQIVEQFVRAGLYNQSDFLTLLVETEGQEIIVNQLKNQYYRSIRLLNEACGIADTARVVLSAPVIKPIDMVIPSDYLFLKQYTIDSIRIINEKNALNLKYKPTVKWFADAGILTSNPWNFYNHFGASAGISLNFPIYDGNQRKLEDKKLLIRENTRSFYLTSTRKQYDQQFIRLKGELEGLNEIKSRLEKQIAVSDQLVKSLKSQLETGLVRMTDYLNALKNYRTINHSLNITDIEMLIIINEMNYILSD
jgi:outer membrane protein TolC